MTNDILSSLMEDVDISSSVEALDQLDWVNFVLRQYDQEMLRVVNLSVVPVCATIAKAYGYDKDEVYGVILRHRNLNNFK